MSFETKARIKTVQLPWKAYEDILLSLERLSDRLNDMDRIIRQAANIGASVRTTLANELSVVHDRLDGVNDTALKAAGLAAKANRAVDKMRLAQKQANLVEPAKVRAVKIGKKKRG